MQAAFRSIHGFRLKIATNQLGHRILVVTAWLRNDLRKGMPRGRRNKAVERSGCSSVFQPGPTSIKTSSLITKRIERHVGLQKRQPLLKAVCSLSGTSRRDASAPRSLLFIQRLKVLVPGSEAIEPRPCHDCNAMQASTGLYANRQALGERLIARRDSNSPINHKKCTRIMPALGKGEKPRQDESQPQRKSSEW